MKKSLATLLILLTTFQVFAQAEFEPTNGSNATESTGLGAFGEIILPVLFISFLVFMLSTLIRMFLDYRLKNKLIDRGMTDQLSAYLAEKSDSIKQTEVVKMAILFCGIGIGLLLVYFSSPIDIHSLAIMAFSLGLSYLAYFFYLRK